MSNRTISSSEIYREFFDAMKVLTPAEKAVVTYAIQSSLGGFPRDLKWEKCLEKALEDESNEPEH